MKKFKTFCKRHRFDFCTFVLLLLALTLGYVKYYINDSLPADEDGRLLVPFVAFLKECISRGELPLWNKYLSAGMSSAGNSYFYLPAIILSILPLKEFVYSYYILHISVGAMFFYLLLKQIGCRKEIASVMAFVYLFSVNLGGLRKRHPGIIIASIYLPIIIYCIEKYLETQKLRWLTIASAVMALQYYGGFLQSVLYTDIFVGIYLVVGCIRRKMEWKKWITHAFMWVCIYFGFIAIKLVPFLEFLKGNSSHDHDSSSFVFFTAYSFHPTKLLQMIFPKIFVNEYDAFGIYYSSGVDIELYMGPVVILLLICGIIMYRKEFRIKAYGIAAILVFCWASIGCFPSIARVLTMIPLIGKTRAQARIIFIFCFLILLMTGYICELLVQKGEYILLLEKAKQLVKWLFIVVAIAFAGALVYSGSRDFENSAYESLIDYFQNSFYRDLILYVICLLAFWCLNYNEQKRSGKNRYIFPVVLLVINLVGVLPFSLLTKETPISELVSISTEEDKFLKENVGNYKVWDDFAELSGLHESSISQNKSVNKRIAAINSYTNFSIPRLYMMLSATDSAPLNNSGMLTGNLLAYNNLRNRNDVLSMLGIKYIIDTEGFLDTDPNSYVYGDEVREIVHLEEIRGNAAEDKLYVADYEVQLKPNTFYKIEFSGSAKADESMYCDFYGVDYDNEEQQVYFSLTSEKEQYNFIIFSGNNVPEYAVFRFVCVDLRSEIALQDVIVTEMDTSQMTFYKLVNSGGDSNIYENVNANDILYFSNVVNLEEGYDLYRATGLGFDQNSYIEEGIELSNTSLNKSITDIDFGINRINANVYTDEESFVNFSQNYDSNWKVYIDGVETKNYMVNGLIMGTYISPGSHILEFCYRPTSIVIGAVITFSTIIILLILFVGKLVRLRLSDKVALSKIQ